MQFTYFKYCPLLTIIRKVNDYFNSKKGLRLFYEMTKLSFNLANKSAILFLIGNTFSPNYREGPIIKSKTQYRS